VTGVPTSTLRVVYVAGARHCGSTLLDAVLGNAPGARSLGEAGGFHRYAGGEPCDCGQPAASCEPCTAARGAVEAHLGVRGHQDLAALPLGERRLWWLAVPSRARAAYAAAADVVFEAAAAATGAGVLVDSSKNVGRAAALALDSAHDVRVVHLVRDGRGYLRSRRRRAAADRSRRARILAAAPLALAPWAAKNLLLSDVLGRRLGPGRYRLCRFEDLVADPEGELAALGRFLDLDVRGLADRARGPGLPRALLYEPRRRLDYAVVRLDPERPAAACSSPGSDLALWVLGAAMGRRWGYTARGPSPPGARRSRGEAPSS